MNTRQNALAAPCRVCNADTEYLFTGFLLKQPVRYFECQGCEYVQTEEPFWLERAYSKVINDSDTGIMARNLANAKLTLGTLVALRKTGGTVIDFAGGYGILVRLLRDYGINALWSDPYCNNLVARGFEFSRSGSALQCADLVTAFEAFEHFVEPAHELTNMLDIAPNVLLSTTLIPSPAPSHDDWWYYGKEHGQHIGFFRQRTLLYFARKHKKHLISDGRSYHLLTSQRINRSYWLALKRGRNAIPLLLSKMLTSKTWSDHELLAESDDGRSN